MDKILLFIFAAGLLNSCANRNKADVIETNDRPVGVRDNQFVVQDKKNLSEALRSLREEVRELEDRVYGTRQYKTYGLWGKLRDCRSQMTEDQKSKFDVGPVERPSDKEYILNWKDNSDAKAGVDSKTGQLIAFSEADLDDTIQRLNKIKSKLEEKEDEISEKLSRCQRR
jgi:hypothetical protein